MDARREFVNYTEQYTDIDVKRLTTNTKKIKGENSRAKEKEDARKS